MISIEKANINHAQLLAEIAQLTFQESHGHSASAKDITNYITEKYSADALKKELQDPANIFHILYHHNTAAGYSKIILNFPYEYCSVENIAKLERIYLLEKFYNLHLGQALLAFNINLIKENKQTGVWLFVWKENERAIQFYIKNGFIVIGSYEFKIAENHSNPNHRMLLRFNQL
ncbi:MAG: GNAT family N-acetyltransferase [Bacteroidota bacterium]|nr:GNAT family N-acetyltransferase [Bacteroidota bacterium]